VFLQETILSVVRPKIALLFGLIHSKQLLAKLDSSQRLVHLAKLDSASFIYTMDFMLIDIKTVDELPQGIDNSLVCIGPESLESFADAEPPEQKTALILFGRLSDASSCCAIITGYRPWVRVIASSRWTLSAIKAAVVKELWSVKDIAENLIIKCEQMPKFYGFHCDDNGNAVKWPSFKIYLPTFNAATRLENSLKNKKHEGLELTDSMTPHAVKAMNELNIECSSWIRLSSFEKCLIKRSTCTVDVITDAKYMSSLPSNQTIAPIKIMSFDAEMYSHDNGFPEVINGDFTIAICATIKTYGSDILSRHAFLLLPSDILEPDLIMKSSAVLHLCHDTNDLLELFRDFIVAQDPDLITGWNIYGFDMPFLWDQYKSSYTKRSLRGSEDLHGQLLKELGHPFLCTRDLLAIATKQDSRIIRSQINEILLKLDVRHRLCIRKPADLPEHIASGLRLSIREILNMDKEYCLQDTDFALLKAMNLKGRFLPTMMPPRRPDSHRRFEYLSRFLCERSSLSEKRMASSAKGDNTYYFWAGRCCVDLMQIIKDDKKLDDNTLKFTAQTYLDPEYGKIDMTPAEIFGSFRSKDLKRIADMVDYCVRDADIPILLIDKLGYVPIWVEMSRVTFTPMHQVLNGGQQRKIYNTIAHFVHNSHALNKASAGWPFSKIDDIDDHEIGDVEDALKKRRPDYQGATVIEPKIGFYTESISTLDFESLYPSIMIHFNLCPSVFVGHDITDFSHLEARGAIAENHTIHHSILVDAASDRYEEFDRTYAFVKNVQGVVPKLLQHLLSARKVAKRAMNAAKDDFERSVQNGRQLALKMSCNSVYGFFGVNPQKGLMSCKPVAAVTTLKGRTFIEAAKAYVETNYEGSDVIYGDTDSIMINWGPNVSVPRAYQLAEEASGRITEHLRSGSIGATRPLLSSAMTAITLANEKVYCPYLLIQKKTYAGLKFLLKAKTAQSLDDFESGIDMKGIDAVRRDRSKLVKSISEQILDALLIQKDLSKAIVSLKSALDSVATFKAPIEWFILSKSLKSTYASENQPHVQAWRRMHARGDQDVPEVGTRMPYVIVSAKAGAKSGPLYERAEHPDYFVRAGLKYDAKYYLENAKEVIVRLLGPTGEGRRVIEFFDTAIIDAETRLNGNTSLLKYFKRARTQ
jgi:DNA polymerase elongation subunit (family B)